MGCKIGNRPGGRVMEPPKVFDMALVTTTTIGSSGDPRHNVPSKARNHLFGQPYDSFNIVIS